MGNMYIDKNGYKRYRDSDILVHRYVAKRKLGRKLYPGEIVHHKNRNKKDNRRKNLDVLPSQKNHYRIHKKSKKKTGKL